MDAYLFDGENVTEYLLGTYGEMTATDFDGDGVIEVFTVDKYLAAEEEGAEDLPALAHLFAWEEGALQELASTAADNSLTNYTSIHFGALDRGLSGVVLDGAKADGSMTTQGLPAGRGDPSEHPLRRQRGELSKPLCPALYRPLCVPGYQWGRPAGCCPW